MAVNYGAKVMGERFGDYQGQVCILLYIIIYLYFYSLFFYSLICIYHSLNIILMLIQVMLLGN